MFIVWHLMIMLGLLLQDIDDVRVALHTKSLTRKLLEKVGRTLEVVYEATVACYLLFELCYLGLYISTTLLCATYVAHGTHRHHDGEYCQRQGERYPEIFDYSILKLLEIHSLARVG